MEVGFYIMVNLRWWMQDTVTDTRILKERFAAFIAGDWIIILRLHRGRNVLFYLERWKSSFRKISLTMLHLKVMLVLY